MKGWYNLELSGRKDGNLKALSLGGIMAWMKSNRKAYVMDTGLWVCAEILCSSEESQSRWNLNKSLTG